MADLELDFDPVVVNVKWRAGDGLTITVTYTDDAGDAVNVSDSTFTAQLRDLHGLDAAATETLTIDDTDAATGVIVATLTGAESTALIESGARSWRGSWDMQRSVTSGQPRTHFYGSAVCSLDVTR